MNAKVEVYESEHEARMAVARYKDRHYPNILVFGPLELIEGTKVGKKGWLVIATHAEVTIAGPTA